MAASMTIKKEPWSQTIYFLGVNFLLQGKYEKALIVFHGLMALDQKNYKAIFAYGETLILLNRLEEALDHFLRQAPMFEIEKSMLIGAARAFVLLGKLKEATTLLEPLVQCSSSKENPYKNQIAKLISDNFFQLSG